MTVRNAVAQIHVKLERTLLHQLKRKARAEHRTVAQHVRYLVERDVESRRKERRS